MAQPAIVKKRGRRWVWVSVGAVVVVSALALFTRAQPPYEFLRGAELIETIIRDRGSASPAGAQSKYVSNESVDAVSAAAEVELEPMGWECRDNQFVAPGGFLDGFIHVLPSDAWDLEPQRARGESVILVVRPATHMDRFRAWLDRVTGRS
jgi:hypothetical protein